MTLHHLLSEAIVGKDVLSCDDALDGTIAGVAHHHVAAVVDPELLQHLVELVVHAHSLRRLNHVRPQVDPLFVVLLDHVQDHALAISFTGHDVDVELAVVKMLILRRLGEAILLVVIQGELISLNIAIAATVAKERCISIVVE